MKSQIIGLNGLEKGPEVEFEFPDKYYGTIEKDFAYFVDTFDRPEFPTLSIGFAGKKGMGKSLLVEMLVQHYVTEEGFNLVKVIENPEKEGVETCINDAITQDTVFYVDEVDKYFSTEEDQNKWLSVLQTKFGHRVLFLFTANGTFSPFWLNRPSRMRYIQHFKGLDSDMVEEIAEDILENPEQLGKSVEILTTMASPNIDLVKEFFNEMNMKGLEAVEVAKYLNIEPEARSFGVTVISSGKRWTTTMNYHPLTRKHIYLHGSYETQPDKDGRTQNRYVSVEIDVDTTDTLVADGQIRMYAGDSTIICTPIEDAKNNITFG